jgi:uncharacterized protein (TIGR02246 family)
MPARSGHAWALALAAVLAGCGGNAGPTQQEVAALRDIAAQSQDRMAIEETLRRYARALDESDMDAYLATLTDDAKFVSAEATHSGKQAIRDYVQPVMTSRLARRAKEGAAATASHHVITNQSIEFTDRDNAVVRAYWMFVVATGEGKPLSAQLMGASEDYLARRDGKWLIRERRVEP